MTVMEAFYGREQDVCVLVQQQGDELTVMVNRTGPKLRIDKYFHLTARSALIKAFDSLPLLSQLRPPVRVFRLCIPSKKASLLHERR